MQCNEEGRTPFTESQTRTYSKAKDFAEKYHIPKVYENIRDIFTDENIDIILLHFHASQYTHPVFKRSIPRHGKHILCEKIYYVKFTGTERSKTINRKENQLILAEAMTIYHMPLYKELHDLNGKWKPRRVKYGSNEFLAVIKSKI
ncbi:MAG: Gfo/Idh/MocA family oxidoreductase [Lachnospiraceae bacterium]